MPDELFVFKYNETEDNLKTDADGIINLPKIKLETQVKVHQVKDGQEANVNHFICVENQEEYLIILEVPAEVIPEPPKVHNMKFKVIDDDGEIVPNATITVKYGKQKAELQTDEFGYAILENVEPGTQIKVVAKGKKKKKG